MSREDLENMYPLDAPPTNPILRLDSKQPREREPEIVAQLSRQAQSVVGGHPSTPKVRKGARDFVALPEAYGPLPRPRDGIRIVEGGREGRPQWSEVDASKRKEKAGARSVPPTSEKLTSPSSLLDLLSDSSIFEDLPLEVLGEEVFSSLGAVYGGKVVKGV